MSDKLAAFKAGIAAVFTAIGAFLGWKGIMAVVWVALMAIDYIAGSLVARHKGEWKSSIAREGLWHKGGMILVVTVAGIADFVLMLVFQHMPMLNFTWPCLVLPLVLAWYIITELGSILETAIECGANVPAWMVKLLNASLKAVDVAGEDLAKEEVKNDVNEYAETEIVE